MAYLPLSTANLPDPAIDPAQGSSPQDYFNTVLWEGNGSYPRSITGVGFQPDFTWLKARSAAYSHILYDAVRGAGLGKELTSTGTDVEGNIQQYTNLTSFDADGFSIGSTTSTNVLNDSGVTFVGWNWKANGSGVSNTDGALTSTVSANTEAGFSICKFDGDSSGTTVGHGLNQAPEMVITKGTNFADNWHTQVYPLIAATKTLGLNITDGALTSNAFNNTAPTSSVFSISTGYASTGRTIVAYCFHSVEGFSKFGSYTGNGSADGPFVYTGFRPSMIMVKASSTTSHWYILDAERNTYNEVDSFLKPNSSNADATSLPFDFTSNGFKIRTSSGGPNSSGATYIYMAFAENPFKYSNAR